MRLTIALVCVFVLGDQLAAQQWVDARRGPLVNVEVGRRFGYSPPAWSAPYAPLYQPAPYVSSYGYAPQFVPLSSGCHGSSGYANGASSYYQLGAPQGFVCPPGYDCRPIGGFGYSGR